MQLTEEVGIKTGGGDEMSHHSNVLYHRICCDLLGHIMSSRLTASVQISEPPDELMHCTVNIQTPQTQVSHHSKHSKVLFQYLTPFYDTYNKNKNKIQLGLLQPWNFSLSLSPSSSWLVGRHSALWVSSSRLCLDLSAPSPLNLSEGRQDLCIKKWCSLRHDLRQQLRDPCS